LVEGVAEAVGVARDGFDHPVGSFGAGVGDAGVQEGEDLWPPGLHGGREAFQLGQVGVGAALVEAVQQVADGLAVRVGAGVDRDD
jgi:hypothetical protein